MREAGAAMGEALAQEQNEEKFMLIVEVEKLREEV